MKKILGLDLGTNSIGWAVVSTNEEEILAKIDGAGSRIIPMSQDVLDNFSGGNPIETQTANRTGYRGTRRLRERYLLRRERLHRILNVLGFLPEHYTEQIDFEKRLGQFLEEKEPKIAYKEGCNEVKNKTDFAFLFQNSFNEMLEDFKANGQNIKIPYDWTIYYLRKKALSHKIDKEELAWLLLNFNQKRGYYQLRGEDDSDATKTERTRKYFDRQIIQSITDTNQIYKGLKVLLVELNSGSKGKIFKKEIPDWVGVEKNIIVTVDIDKDGNDRFDENGLLNQRFSIPTEAEWGTEWKLIKLKTEKDLSDSGKTVGTYIYETLLQNPSQKIRGKLVRTIERKFYKDELISILKKQIELQPELFTEDLYNDCIRELYRNKEAHQLVLSKRDFVHLFVNDIIFYQRPLRSQKSTISDCTLEFRIHKDKDGNKIKEYLKAVPKSNPIYQEFRLWQWLFNLKIYTKEDEQDVTAEFIASNEDKVKLFDFLNGRKEIEQKALLKQFKLSDKAYRWNYVEDKKYSCNETGIQIRSRLTKVENVSADFLTPEIEQKLWHIIYSVTDKNEFEKALKTFANKYNLDEISFVENFKKFPPFKSEYGSFSEKAIKKLLPLMRLGKYWNFDSIDEKTQDRIYKILTGEYDETIKDRVRDKAINLTTETDFQGLQLWLAQYIVYDRHSEANNLDKWNSVADLEKYLEEFKQHSLRNPIVEQVITETLRVVRDIWKKYGDLSEIHIELGRDMKNTKDERVRLSQVVSENENTNLRIKALIMELKDNYDVENVRPYSPIQQEILKIYEEYAVSNIQENDEEKDFVKRISTTAQPSKTELQRYKLWLEQKYCSPYTGQMIPLGKLFTDEYQIEHIIPKSRYFDDSLNNKVICESAVNQLKDKQLGLEFIKNHHGEKVECGMGKMAEIFSEEAYQIFIKEHYTKNRSKKNNLLLEDIPDKMIARQMNDTRYISKFISALLSNIVRADTNDDGVNSKNIIPCNGKITTALKQDWGLNDIWNDLILPRFERMNALTNSTVFTAWNEQYQKFLPTVPLDLSKGFQKKRIDHRHHAMDAIVIACATSDHLNLLNNQSAKSDHSRYDLQNKLRNKEKWIDKDGKERDKFTEFKKPWDNFAADARKELEKIVVSFKQNLRVINKATNKYEKIKDGKKIEINQEGTNWAIRKPLHKDTVFAKVSLRKIKTVRLNVALKDWKSIVDKELKEEIKRLDSLYGSFDEKIVDKYFKDRKYQFKDVDVSKVDIYYFDHENAATRKNLDTSFNVKAIESITDSGIQKILLNHLTTKENNPDLAFSPEGIEEMNQNIVNLNNGKFHQPIYKVRVYEPIGNKFQVGYVGNKKDKYVVAEAGTNLFFVVYKDNGKRNYETIPLNEVIEHQKWRGSLSKEEQKAIPIVPIKNDRGKFEFYLSPNDFVYVPTAEQLAEDINIGVNEITPNRIYKFTDSSDTTANFVPATVASLIFNMKKKDQEKNKIDMGIQNEFGVGSPQSKNQRAITGEMIKEICVKLQIDRLGNIIKTGGGV